MTIEAALVDYATSRCDASRVEIVWLGFDPMQLTAGGKASFDGDPCRAHPQLSLTWSTGDDIDRYTLRPKLSVWVPALVAPEDVAIGEVLSGVVSSVPLAAGGAARWSEGPVVALTSISAGEALTHANSSRPYDALSGSAVIVKVRVGDLEVRTEGRLLGDGRIGDRVQVHIKSTGAALSGVLTTIETVELR